MTRKEITRKVVDDFNSRRVADEQAYDLRIAELSDEIDGFADVMRELSTVGLKLFGASVKGGDTDSAVAQIRRDTEALRAKKEALLIGAGYPADYASRKYRCEKCSDSGFVGLDMCSCLRSEIIEAEIENCGIGKLIRTQSFDNFRLDYYDEQDRAIIKKNAVALYNFANGFGADTSDSFLMLGATGLGKTHLSSAVAKKVIERGYDVVYRTAQSAMMIFERQRFGDGFRGDGTERELFDADLLIIDDLGTEVTTQYTIACLYELINSRLNDDRPTIISTNLTKDELRERYADRIMSRLFGEYRPLLFRGGDIRQKKLSEK